MVILLLPFGVEDDELLLLFLRKFMFNMRLNEVLKLVVLLLGFLFSFEFVDATGELCASMAVVVMVVVEVVCWSIEDDLRGNCAK